jgi:hypothetical protein
VFKTLSKGSDMARSKAAMVTGAQHDHFGSSLMTAIKAISPPWPFCRPNLEFGASRQVAQKQFFLRRPLVSVGQANLQGFPYIGEQGF